MLPLKKQIMVYFCIKSVNSRFDVKEAIDGDCLFIHPHNVSEYDEGVAVIILWHSVKRFFLHLKFKFI